jgi:hypothetical protein
VPEAITELKAELRRSKDYPTAWEDFLGQITFGVLGRQRSGPFSDVPPTRTPAAIQADIDKFTRAHAGLGGGPEADADEVRRWQEYLNNLQNIERGGGRFRKPLGSALADAATGRTVMGLENQTAANQGIAASLEEAAKALTTAARIARESGSKQEQENTRAEHELRRQR